MSTASKLAAGEEVMHVADVAVRWAAELRDTHWMELDQALVMAGLRGEFDYLHAAVRGHGLWMKGEKLTELYPCVGADIMAWLGQSSGFSIDWFLPFARDNQTLGLHRDAVLAFAESKQLRPPGWWATPASKHPGGAPPILDWAKVEAALEAECRLQGSVPHRGHGDKDWRTNAAAYRWVREEHLRRPDGGPPDSTLKDNVPPMLKRIAARLKDGN